MRKRELSGDKANAALFLDNSNAVPFRWLRGRFMCAYCPRVFPSIEGIRRHSVEHPDKLEVFRNRQVRNSFPLRVDVTDLTCSLCSAKSDTIEKFKAHLSDNHMKVFRSESEDGLIPFILIGNGFKCTLCSASFESFLKLYVHMNVHYQSFVCPVCGRGFSNNHKLRAHYKCHETGELACAKCGTTFANRLARNRHLAMTHRSLQRYRCPVCGEHFDSYHSRLRHLDKEHGQQVEYKCRLCPSVFGTGTLRNSHEKVVHATNR